MLSSLSVTQQILRTLVNTEWAASTPWRKGCGEAPELLLQFLQLLQSIITDCLQAFCASPPLPDCLCMAFASSALSVSVTGWPFFFWV